MNEINGKRVLIFQQRRWAMSIGHFLAKKLQAEGCKLAALTAKKSVHNFVISQTDVKYDLIISSDVPKSRPKEYLNGVTYSLTEICEDLGIDTIWPLVAGARFHVKSYKDKYYYGFKQNVSDEGITDYIMAVYKYIKIIFSDFKPDLIIAPNFATLHHMMFNLYAKKRGIKMLAVTDTKIRGQWVSTYNYHCETGPFYEHIDSLNDGCAETQNRQLAKNFIKEFRQEFKIPTYCDEPQTDKNFIKKIRSNLSPLYQILMWYLKKSEDLWESIGVTPDYRPPKIILRDYFSQKKYQKFADNFNYTPLESIKNYVYFPLQVQPEESIDVYSPFFNNQIETARLVAMSLPGDYTLVVKDHPGMSNKRPPSYLQKIDRTVNVKLVDYRLSSEKILKRADMVISPGGTVIAEAAFLIKPVIQLGDLGTTLKLPNVFKHTDMRTLSKKIKEVWQVNLHTPEYERRLENFVAAAYDKGIDVNYLEIWQESDKKNMKQTEKLWEFYKKEILDILR